MTPRMLLCASRKLLAKVHQNNIRWQHLSKVKVRSYMQAYFFSYTLKCDRLDPGPVLHLEADGAILPEYAIVQSKMNLEGVHAFPVYLC